MDRDLRNYGGDYGKRGFLAPAIFLMVGALLILGGFLLSELNTDEAGGGANLIIAAAVTAFVLAAPTYYEYRRGRFDFFHPLTYAVWSYLFPAFCIGAVVLATGLNKPYFLSFIDQPEYTLPLSLAYVCLGFLGLTAGFYLPWSDTIGSFLDSKMPSWDWGSPGVWFAGLFLLLCGGGFNIVGFLLGALGFQRVDRVGEFDALIVFFALFFFQGIMLVWLAFFRQDTEKPILTYLLLAFLICLIPARSFLFGSRGELLGATIGVGMAFWYSGRRIRKWHVACFGVLITLALSVGVIWATTFRSVKGSEARINSGDYIGQLKATADYLADENLGIILANNSQALLERIETVSSLGVSVSNYEKHAPYEEAYGLDNNILRDAATSVVPRFLWTEKPGLADPRAYGDLYFNYSENSFAVTPFADLLRNFGVPGVFLGMMLVGVYLSVVYRILIKTENPTIWKTMAYLPMLMVISYETFYSVYLASILRVLLVITVSVVVIQFFIGKLGLRR